MKRTVVCLLACLVAATPISAGVVDGATAKKALFPTRGHLVQLSPDLTPLQKKIVTGIIPLMAKQLRQPVRYYAAIAWSPQDGLVHESIQAAMNHHSPGAAASAAISACNQLRSKGAPPCKIAAQIVPKDYKKRPLTLSVDATAAFEARYLKMKAPKAFAVSPKTGAWAIGRGDAEAVSGCKRAAKSTDCEVIIRN